MAAHVIDGNALADELDCLYVSERLPGDVELADTLATLGELNADPRGTRRAAQGGARRCWRGRSERGKMQAAVRGGRAQSCARSGR